MITIYSNLAISLDGKIATSRRGFFPLGTGHDHRRMFAIRDQVDAVLIGGSTLRSHPNALYGTKKSNPPLNILVSRKLQGLSPRSNFFQDTKTERLVFLSDSDKNLQKRFQNKCTLKELHPKRSVSLQILKELERLKVKRLLIEGGGEIMWEFAKKNLINRYYVTLTPRILGGKTSPTLVDGLGFTPEKSLQLRLKKSEVIGDEIFLIYEKK